MLSTHRLRRIFARQLFEREYDDLTLIQRQTISGHLASHLALRAHNIDRRELADEQRQADD